MTTSSKRTSRKLTEVFLGGIWVSCSLETTDELSKAFIVHTDSISECQDISMLNNVLFKINHLSNTYNRDRLIFHIYSGGIEKIEKLCGELRTEGAIYDILKRYFIKYFKEKPQSEWVTFKSLIKVLASHYVTYRKKDNIYKKDDERCLSFIYPMTHSDTSAMYAYLRNLTYSKGEKISKDRFYVTQ